MRLGPFHSVENIGEVVFAENFGVLLMSNTEALEQVVEIGSGELSGIFELSHVVLELEMLFDSLNNVALSVKLEELLGDNNVSVVKRSADSPQIANVFVQVSRVAESALVVRNGPGGGRHDTHVVVPVLEGEGSHHGVLRTEGGAAG